MWYDLRMATKKKRMGRPPKPEGRMVELTIRLSRADLDRVEKHAKALSKRAGGVSVTRSEAIRVLLTGALDRAKRRGS